jgi:hypothetical protein
VTLLFEMHWMINATPPHHRHPDSEQPRRELHKDWRMWVAVVLMLAAIMIYVLSLDDSLLSLVVATAFC